ARGRTKEKPEKKNISPRKEGRNPLPQRCQRKVESVWRRGKLEFGGQCSCARPGPTGRPGRRCHPRVGRASRTTTRRYSDASPVPASRKQGELGSRGPCPSGRRATSRPATPV